MIGLCEAPRPAYDAAAVSQRTLVIVNPKSRGGRRAGRWPAVERALRARLDKMEVVHTTGPRDAERLACEGVRGGAERIVVAGGDGTASEVASGLLSASLGRAVELAFLPFGTGCDWARGLGIRGGLQPALDALTSGRVRDVDAGRVTLHDAAGRERQRHFLNVGSVGLAAVVVDDVAGRGKVFGGRLAFAAGFLRSLRGRCPTRLGLAVDGRPVMDEKLDIVAVANGRFFGGGMQLAPTARWDDGVFEVIAVRAMGTAQWLRRIPLVYSGRHLALDEVVHFRGREIEVAWRGAEEHAPRVELDGEPAGRAPVRFALLPGALRVLVPRSG